MSPKHLVKLNLGCGRRSLPGWINVDLAAPGHDPDIELDLEAPYHEWTYKLGPRLEAEGSLVNHSQLIHVIEHLHKPLHVMECLWQLTEPGGTVTVHCPHGASDDAWEDPTHVRPYFPDSFKYFSQLAYWRADYGYRGDWEIDTVHLVGHDQTQAPTREAVRFARNQVYEMRVTMHAVKPARDPQLGGPQISD